MVLHNPNNWHWVNKDVSEWTRQWFEENLTKLDAEDGETKVKVSKIVSCDGEADVSQRKGKVITIYELKLVLEYSGSTPEAEDVSGTITVPEVAHDTEEDEFVFEVEIYSDAKEKAPVKDLIRSKLLAQLRKEFVKLPSALIAEHGKDIQHAPGHDASSGFPAVRTLPQPTRASKESATSTTKSGSGSGSGSVVNTTTVSDTEEFRTTAEELYKTFTDPQRIAAFTRAPPKVFEGAKEGGKFELFGGNVVGEYLELNEPTKIVQSWRLQQWPAGHYSNLEIQFDQNDVDAVTVMRVNWKGVPVDQEEVTKENWKNYYVHSIKKTFGFGSIL